MADRRIALVTGANKGIGFETCRQLAQQGVKVLLGARSLEKGEAAARQLREEGLDVETVLLDITDPGQIKEVEKHLADTYGRLDILVNNAGAKHPEEPLFESSVETISAAALRSTFEVNFFGTVQVTLALLPLIRKSEAGRIVNVSSMLASLAIHANPKHPMIEVKPFAYSSSKAALNQFTIHLAAALRNTSIKVNSAHPGWVRTDLGGPAAIMDVEEGAQTTVRLATLSPDGPSGKFLHFRQELPW
jgi:NAD(P)-dependent dehydrogenase (short-subunit alcohol dehydrogenase family)